MSPAGGTRNGHGPHVPSDVTVVIITKEPVAGRVKTRLCPPLTPREAADLAEASLTDTLSAVSQLHCRRVVALDGDPGPWLPGGFDVVPQRGEGLGERLASAFEDVGGPAVVVGSDTPQVTPSLLRTAIETLTVPEVDAVLGRAYDGGFWTIGLVTPDRRVFEDVPMSVSDTGDRQADRLRDLGLRTADLPVLRDVDLVTDLAAVAAQAPDGRFAATWRLLRDKLPGSESASSAAF